MPTPSQQRIEVYDPRVHGSLDEYVKRISEDEILGPFPIFKRPIYYQELRDGGYFLPFHSEITLISQQNVRGTSYFILDDFMLCEDVSKDPLDPMTVLQEDQLWEASGIFSLNQREEMEYHRRETDSIYKEFMSRMAEMDKRLKAGDYSDVPELDGDDDELDDGVDNFLRNFGNRRDEDGRE